MVPANRRRAKKDALQQARRRRGAEWEADLVAELNQEGYGWAVLLPSGWVGQPFDITATVQGLALGIECKRIAAGKLGYSAFTVNERENLSRLEDAGGMALVAVYRDSDQRRAFIPWYAIRADVLGGIRGSADPAKFPEEMLKAWEVPRP